MDTTGSLVGSASSTSTAGNDTFNAILDDSAGSTVATLTTLDSIDGGAGTDTLNISDVKAAGSALPSGLVINNVENVVLRGAGVLNVDTSAWTGVQKVSSIQSTDVTLKAVATADIQVAGATGAITVDGGKDVVVTDATTDKAIVVGGTTAPAGTITVTDSKQGTGTIDVDGGTSITVTATTAATTAAIAGGAITVGGVTPTSGAVAVVQNLTSTGGDAEADDLTGGAITVTGGSTVSVTVNATSTAKDESSDGDIIIGAVTVNGDGKTTAVTVVENASATTYTKAGAALVKETAVVTFNAMKNGETLIFNGLTFTAAQDLTAAQVAAAFANLASADTQSSGGITANGIYSGTFNTAVWTSGAVSGNVVTFTAQDQDETDLVFTGTATTNDAGARIPTQVKTVGSAAGVDDTSANTVSYSTVIVDDVATAAIKTVTINGYGASSKLGSAAGKETDALETLNLSKAAGTVDLVVADTADTLALSLSAMGTSASAAVLTFTAAPLTLNATSTGDNYVNLTAAATKTLNVSGTGLLDISTTDMAALETVKVTGSAGLKLNAAVANTVTSVDTTGTTGTVTVTIDASAATYAGGAGVDNVTLSATTVDKAVSLGAGDDSLTLATGTNALTSEMIGGDGTDTLVMASADAEAASATATFETKITSFERLSLGVVAAAATDTINLANMDDINYVITAGQNATAVKLVLDNMAVGGTLEYTGAVGNAAGVTDVNFVSAAGGADSFNVKLNVAAADLDFQDLDITGIENLNLTVTDTVPVTAGAASIDKATIALLDTSLKTITITGNADLALTADSTALTLVDGSAMTGALTASTNGTVAQTLKGGSGADNLTANASQDVLVGGAGADTLTVADGKNLVTLQGGAGADTYNIGEASNVNGYATISGSAADLAGDIINFNTPAGGFTAAKLVLGNTAVFQDYANEAAKSTVADNNVSWFQYGGDTYVVQNNSTLASFENGVDSIVKITGLVDLTYNSTAFQIEIA